MKELLENSEAAQESVPTVTQAKSASYISVCRVLTLLEAAIGIEPMNKGFAVLAKLFA
jgi:hypothetical protein